ncbi:MAG: phosphonate ABC transporter, permease protein PhnE [Candidatus Bipolaricaulota bacterium]
MDAERTTSRSGFQWALVKRRGLSFFLDWISWGYIAYAVMYLLNYYWYTVHVDWYGTLHLPSWGWPLAVLGTLELAVWSRALGRSLGLRAFGLELCGRGGEGAPFGRRVLRTILWHFSVLPLGIGVWLGKDVPWHDRLAGTMVQAVPKEPVRAGRQALATQWGVMGLVLLAITVCLGWLIIGINLGVLGRRASKAGEVWRQMLRPDFRYFLESDPTFALRNLSYSILDLMVVTIFMAFLATALGGAIAFPVSFFGARNIMGFGPTGWAVYGIVRGFFNLFRSIETILWAVVFAIWVGFGTFAGVLALTIHTIAALGKLYSEQVEGVAPGPLEGVWAAGGSRAQVVRYAVIPQVLPSFWAFTLYRWDINVRMATVVALVGGGGIGDMLFYYKNLGDWAKVGAVVMVIVAVVWTMDYISGRLRERIT